MTTKKHCEHTPLLISSSSMYNKKDEEAWISASTSSSHIPSSSCTFNLLISIFIPSLSGFVFGYDQTVIESILSLPNFQHHYFDKNKVTFINPFNYLTIGFYLMAILGTMYGSYICDFAGRKKALIGSYILLCLGTLFYTCFIHSIVFLLGRMIIGFAFGLILVVSPIIIAELAPSDIRGCLVGFLTLFIMAGNLSGYYMMNAMKPTMSASIISSNNKNHHPYHFHFFSGDFVWQYDWRSPLLLESFFLFLLILAQYHLPESPRWLALAFQQESKKQDNSQHNNNNYLDTIYFQGLQTIAFLQEKDQNHVLVRQTWKQLCHADCLIEEDGEDHHQKNNQSLLNHIKKTFLFFLKQKKTILLGCIFIVANYMTGFEVIVKYYASDIIYAAGLPTTSPFSAPGCIKSILMASTAISLGWFVDNIDRKIMLMMGSMMVAMCQFSIGIIFYHFTSIDLQTGTLTIVSPHARTLVSASVYILMASYAFTWGSLIMVTILEWFSTVNRARGVAIIMVIYWSGQWLMLVSSPWHFFISASLIYFIYGISTLFTCYFVYRWVPNTTKISLDHITDNLIP
ncbi:major facilitator superfamily domain-containing protein [Cunninghamella echinulata]|nr:major facilitator superfamily domain-containing protein [Cunninghamella echinulata]